MSGSVAREKVTVDGLVAAFIRLRQRSGISVKRLENEHQLLSLDVVRTEAAVAAREKELAVIAHWVLTCALQPATAIVEPLIREGIYIELNFDSTPTDYTARKGEVVNRQGLQHKDYEALARTRYAVFANRLIALERSTCGKPSTALADSRRRDIERAHADFAVGVLERALWELVRTQGREDALRIAERILATLPKAVAALRSLRDEGRTAPPSALDQVARLYKAALEREYPLWERALGMSPFQEHLRRIVAYAFDVPPPPRPRPRWVLDSVEFPRGTPPKRSLDIEYPSLVLAAAIRSIENEDRWLEVLADPGSAAASASTAPAPVPA